MKFPILIIKPNHRAMYKVEKEDFAFISAGSEEFYEGGTIYDSDGVVYTIKGIKGITKASFFKRMQHMRAIFKVDVEYNKSGKITLEKLKEVILEHITQHTVYWEKVKPIEDLTYIVNEKENYTELYTFFK